MTDKNNESALLLRMNKEEQVSVLQEIGFTSVNENTPASDIAKYIRWAPLAQITVQNTCV